MWCQFAFLNSVSPAHCTGVCCATWANAPQTGCCTLLPHTNHKTVISSSGCHLIRCTKLIQFDTTDLRKEFYKDLDSTFMVILDAVVCDVFELY